MKMYIVVKSTLSGWFQKIVIAFSHKSDAENYIKINREHHSVLSIKEITLL